MIYMKKEVQNRFQYYFKAHNRSHLRKTSIKTSELVGLAAIHKAMEDRFEILKKIHYNLIFLNGSITRTIKRVNP